MGLLPWSGGPARVLTSLGLKSPVSNPRIVTDVDVTLVILRKHEVGFGSMFWLKVRGLVFKF